MIEFAFRLDPHPDANDIGVDGYIARVNVNHPEYKNAFTIGRISGDASLRTWELFYGEAAIRLASVLKDIERDYLAGCFLEELYLHVPLPGERYEHLMETLKHAPDLFQAWTRWIQKHPPRFVSAPDVDDQLDMTNWTVTNHFWRG